MRHSRYQLRNVLDPEREELPRDTVCTILTRQSTQSQGIHNPFSDELNAPDLVAFAERLGFAPDRIRVVDADMGIGAYSTTIGERPGLRQWLQEWLPAGISRVVLVSQEDRLFRDKWEDQHNAFIKQVAEHGGWVLCTRPVPHVYNFRREMDCEQFRMACKYGRLYIEHHIKGRLHPAVQRAAMQGRYSGGVVPWGYIVDYDPRSPTYKRLVPYAVHVPLVVDHIFRYFAQLRQPTLIEVVRHWEQNRLVFPFYGPEVDPRVVRAAATRLRDEVRQGYLIDTRQVQRALTNVAYLGWRVRAGEVAWDRATNAPLLCHEPLVEPDLFWFCYDALYDERPSWAPPRVTPIHTRPRGRRSTKDEPGEIRSLASGRIRCAVHQTRLATRRLHGDGPVYLACNGKDYRLHGDHLDCAYAPGAQLDRVVSEAFLEHLTLDDDDVAEMARLVERRQRLDTGRTVTLQREIDEAKGLAKRALQLALRETDTALAEDIMAEVRKQRDIAAAKEAELEDLAMSGPTSSWAWNLAGRLGTLADRIRSTFLDWSRAAQARVIALALNDGVIGYIDRQRLGVWLQWHGERESHRELVTRCGKHLAWTEAEEAALQQHYTHLTYEALMVMLPQRSLSAIRARALKLGLQRPHESELSDIVPCIVAGPTVANVMTAYGFPLPSTEAERSTLSSRAS